MILGDQSAGLISTVDSLNSVFYSQLQFCNWYTVQAIKVKFIKLKYTIEELDGFINDKVEMFSFINYTQVYIQSDIVEVLKVNRVILIKILKVKDQIYISQTQVIKKYYIIFYYTKTFANLNTVAI